ncbi:MAG TPA: C4-type zinc ribbon domain-containing protein [Dermatophilaceae bacterium]|nr:C4-type zinc ribbon domain-containing protein [Dermatophilaceae bacterium]
MKADPGRQWRLLDLQALDTRLGQIAHRSARLPQDVELSERHRGLEQVEADLVATRTAWQDLQRELVKAEADVDLVRDRAARDRRLLDSGSGSAKDLQGLQHELASLNRRQGELEEIQLTVMERSEALQEQLTALEARGGELAEAVAQTTTRRDDALAELNEERDDILRRREDVAAGVGDDLLTLYEKIRTSSGIGAAVLRQRRCEGCRLELVGADMQRIAAAHPDEVIRCEECRRILVRTAESGL